MPCAGLVNGICNARSRGNDVDFSEYHSDSSIDRLGKGNIIKDMHSQNRLAKFLEVRARDPHEKGRGQLLSVSILSILILVMLLLIVNSVQFITDSTHSALIYVITDLAILLFCGVCLFVNRAGWVRLAAYGFLLGQTVIITVSMPVSVLDRLLLFYTIPILISSFVLPPASSFLFAFLSAAGYSLGYFISQPPFSYNYVFAPVLFMLASGAWLISTRLNQVLAEAHEAQEKFKALVEQSPAVFYLDAVDEASSAYYMSPQVEALFGYTVDEWMSQRDLWPRLLHPDDRDWVLLENERTNQTGDPFVMDYRVITQDGKVRWVHDNAVLARDEKGQPLFWRGVLYDITDRKLAEESVRHERDLVRSILDASPEPTAIVGLRGKILDCNEAAYRVLGCSTREQLVGRVWLLFLSRQYRILARQTIQTVIKKGSVKDVKFVLRTLDRREYPAEVSVNLIRDVYGKPQAFVIVMEDISERERVAASLQRYAEQMGAVSTITRALAETLDLSQIYDQLAQSIYRLLPDIAVVLIYLYDPERQLITCDYGLVEGSKRIPAYELPNLASFIVGEGTHSYIIQTRQPLIVDHLPESQRRIQVQVGDEEKKVSSALHVLMLCKGRVIGILQVQSVSPSRFTNVDADLLSMVGNTAAIAIENARLLTETGRRLERLNALREVDIAITASLNLQVTLSILLEQVITQLHASAADVLLLNPNTQILECAAGRGFHTNVMRLPRMRVGEGLAGRTVLERRIVYVPSLAEQRYGVQQMSLFPEEKFKSYYGVPLIAKGQVQGVLEVFDRERFNVDAEWMSYLEALASQAAIAIENATLFDELQRTNDELVLSYDATIEAWAQALDVREWESSGHSKRVANLAVWLGRLMSISESDLVLVRRGALLHDIGKVSIPDSILRKSGSLTDKERELMHQYPVYSRNLLAGVQFLKSAVDIPYCHCECWDGSGYPRGLKGEDIPLVARIFSVVDVWDTLSSNRLYRVGWPEEKIRTYLLEESGKQFDPGVVKLFLSSI